MDGGEGYPFECPKCGRPYRQLIPLEVHLDSFDHNNPPEDYDPADMEWKPKKRKERLKELEERDRNNESAAEGEKENAGQPGTHTPARTGNKPTANTPGSSRRACMLRVRWPLLRGGAS